MKTTSNPQNQNNKLFIQLLRYSIAGGIAFLADISILYFCKENGHIHYLIAAALGFCVGLSITYLLSITWVFPTKQYSKKWLELLLFIIIGVVGLGLNELFIWIFTHVFTVYYLISKILTTVIVFFWNFIARKMILFNPIKQHE